MTVIFSQEALISRFNTPPKHQHRSYLTVLRASSKTYSSAYQISVSLPFTRWARYHVRPTTHRVKKLPNTQSTIRQKPGTDITYLWWEICEIISVYLAKRLSSSTSRVNSIIVLQNLTPKAATSELPESINSTPILGPHPLPENQLRILCVLLTNQCHSPVHSVNSISSQEVNIISSLETLLLASSTHLASLLKSPISFENIAKSYPFHTNKDSVSPASEVDQIPVPSEPHLESRWNVKNLLRIPSTSIQNQGHPPCLRVFNNYTYSLINRFIFL